MQTAHQLGLVQQHYDNLADDFDDGIEDLADAAGMTVEEFRAECARINESDAREAAFAD